MTSSFFLFIFSGAQVFGFVWQIMVRDVRDRQTVTSIDCADEEKRLHRLPTVEEW